MASRAGQPRRSGDAARNIGGRRRLSIDTIADADGDLLESRLHRLPSVLDGDIRRSAALAIAG